MDTLKFPIYTKHNDFTFVMQLSKHRALVAQGSELMPYGTFEVNVEPAVHHYWTEYEEGKAIEITRADYKLKFNNARLQTIKPLWETELKGEEDNKFYGF